MSSPRLTFAHPVICLPAVPRFTITVVRPRFIVTRLITTSPVVYSTLVNICKTIAQCLQHSRQYLYHKSPVSTAHASISATQTPSVYSTLVNICNTNPQCLRHTHQYLQHKPPVSTAHSSISATKFHHCLCHSLVNICPKIHHCQRHTQSSMLSTPFIRHTLMNISNTIHHVYSTHWSISPKENLFVYSTFIKLRKAHLPEQEGS